jgi:hypothetical protein
MPRLVFLLCIVALAAAITVPAASAASAQWVARASMPYGRR